MVISLGPISRGAMHPGAVEVLDGVGRQLDGGVEGVAVEGQERAEPERDPLLELLGLGLVAEPDGAVALQPAGVAAGARWSRPEGLAVDHLDFWSARSLNPWWTCIWARTKAASSIFSVQICWPCGPLPTGVSRE